MVHGPAANAIWLQYLAPGWVLLGGVLWLREPVTAADVRMMLCCLSGVLLILLMEMWSGSAAVGYRYGDPLGRLFCRSRAGDAQLRDVDPAWLITLNHAATVVAVDSLGVAGTVASKCH